MAEEPRYPEGEAGVYDLGKSHVHGWRCDDTHCPHCGCCHIKWEPGCECDQDGCQCLLGTLNNWRKLYEPCPTCNGEGSVRRG